MAENKIFALPEQFSFGQFTKGEKLVKAINESASTTPPDRLNHWEPSPA